MKKIFTTNLFLLLLVNILIKPFWIFGIDRTVQNTLGAGEYGMFYTLFNLSLLFNILLDLGITNFNNREISRHPQLLGKYLSNTVGIKMLLAIFYAVFTISVAVGFGYSSRQVSLLLLLVVNQFLSSLILYLRSNLSGLQLFKLDSVLSVLDKSVMILVCGILLWSNVFPIQFNIEFFILAQTFSYTLSAGAIFLIVLKKTGGVTFKLDLPFTVSMLRKSFPYALLMLLMTIYGRIDSVIIERLLPNGNEAAGVYAQAFRLLDAANMFPFLFASLLLPIFSKMIKDNARLTSFVGFSTILLIVPVISLAVPTIVFRTHVMGLLYHEHVQLSSKVLGILMGSFVAIAVGYVFGTLLTALGAIKHLNYVSAIAVFLSIGVQLLLVTQYGVVGAAIGNLITNGAVVLLTVGLALLHFKFTIDFSYVIKFLVFTSFSVIITVLAYSVIPIPSIAYILSIFLVFMSAFAIRLINFREIISFFAKDAPLE